MTLLDILSAASVIFGSMFFLSATIGLIRFPDLLTRLHALTKGENVGLAFIILGLIIQAPTVWYALKLIVIWLLIQISSASVAFLIARTALDQHEYDQHECDQSCQK